MRRTRAGKAREKAQEAVEAVGCALRPATGASKDLPRGEEDDEQASVVRLDQLLQTRRARHDHVRVVVL